MKKERYIMIMIIIGFLLLILTNYISMNYIETKFWVYAIEITYVIITGSIGLVLYKRVQDL